MPIVIALIVLLIGSILFHFLSPWKLTPLASNWGAIDTTVAISFWVTGMVFIAVIGFTAWCVYRYRFDPNRRAGYEPENKKLELWLTIGTTIGIAALLAPGLMAWGSFVRVPDDAHKFEVLGQQWHWRFRFPGEDGQFGRVHPRFMSEDNPFGLDPDDPAGFDDILIDSPEVLLPVDRPAHVHLRSRDVIHNFMVANFRAKMDALPGQMSYFWFTPTRVGEYQAVCAQHCGLAHFAMRAWVKVVEPGEFDTWLAGQPTFGQLQNRPPADPAAGEAQFASCAACHGPAGEGNPAMNAPKLAGLDAWYLERQFKLFRDGARGAHEDDLYGSQMAAEAARLSDAALVRDISAYLDTLPDEPAAGSIAGDRERGRRLYRTCANCHGREGQGIAAMNAPRLAGIDDWYLARQIRNFRDGVRGRHPQDMYGNQMVDMVQHLNDGAVADLVSWIRQFPQPGSEIDLAHVESTRNSAEEETWQ